MKKLMIITSLLIALIVSLPITLAATQNLIYDANGNLITGDGKYRIYDGFNHLIRIRDGNNATGLVLEEYDWHPLEERTLVKHVYENGSWKESIYYPSKDFVRVKNTSGTYDYKYIYQNGQLVAQEFVGGQKNFMLSDHKGTVQVVVNESGAKVEETFYSPFGEIISGGATSRFSYEGKEFDSVVGDYDYHARKYCPQTSTFCQPDTILPNVYDPQQLNRYAFERNNPYKYEDEGGHIFWLPIVFATIEAVSFGIALLAFSIAWYNNAIELKAAYPDRSNADILVSSALPEISDSMAKSLISKANPATEVVFVYEDVQTIKEVLEYDGAKGPTETDPKLKQDKLDKSAENNPKPISTGINSITGNSIANYKATPSRTQNGGGSGGGGKYGLRTDILREEAEKGIREGKTAGQVIKSSRARQAKQNNGGRK